MKWVEKLRYLRIAVFVILFIFLSSLLGLFVAGRDSAVVFYYGAIVSSIILGVLIVIYIVFKILENEALKERINWLIKQIELPKENSKLEELRLALMKFHPELGEKVCSICGLEILENAIIIQCLKCDKLFHDKHFINWLRENEACPNCKNLILPFD